MDSTKISVDEVVALAAIIRATWEHQTVNWFDSDEQEIPNHGVAAGLVANPEDPQPLDGDDDPREAWLEVTTADGTQYAKLSEVVETAQEGTFTIVDRE